jgi:alkaline phosphatase
MLNCNPAWQSAGRDGNVHNSEKFLRPSLVILVILAVVWAGQPISAAPAPVRTLAPASTAAKYVIILHGDGMGPEHVKAGGMYVNGSPGTLPFEAFANKTTMTHNNATGGVTDSAASATTMATGVKVNNGVISVRLPGDGAELPSLLEMYRDRAKSTGLVTESYLTDASPAAHGAHDTSRNNYAAIFTDFISQSRPNVLLGGGGNGFDSAAAISQGYAVVTDRAALLGLNTEAQTRVAGGFGGGLILPPGSAGRSDTLPNLAEMAGAALQILDNDPDGFLLFVEEEGIDEAAHANKPLYLSLAMAEFSAAAQKVLDWVEDPTNAADWNNTLVIVLADHETGGLTVTANNGRGQTPGMAWTTTGHTATPVPVYARGVGADQITGAQIDNTAIFTLLQPSGPALCTAVTLTTGADTWLDVAPSGANTPHGADLKLVTDGSPDNSILLKWNLSAIPAGSTISAATMSFYMSVSQDQSSHAYEFYALRRNWSETNATWNNADTDAPWGTAGAQNTVSDRDTTVLETSPTGGTPPTWVSTALNLDGVTQLRRWLDGSAPYYGFAIQDYADTTSDGFRFNAFNSTNPPRLAVKYCLPAAAPIISSTPDDPGLMLEWRHLATNAHYEVWRSPTPYFIPKTTPNATRRETLSAPISSSTLTHIDSPVTSVGGTYFTVLGVDALDQPSAPSNYVGIFRFSLVSE